MRLAEVLVPQRHPEAMDVPLGELGIGVDAVRLVCANGDLGVPVPRHGPLVEVGRSDNDVLVINWKSSRLNVRANLTSTTRDMS